MKTSLILTVLVVCLAVVILPMGREVVAGVAEKVSKAKETLKCEPSVKRRIEAVRALGDANDCESDCDCSKTEATRMLQCLAEGDCDVAAAARKELRKDLKRKESSVTRQRVIQTK